MQIIKTKSFELATITKGDENSPKAIHELNTEHDYRLHEDMINEVNDVAGKFLDQY